MVLQVLVAPVWNRDGLLLYIDFFVFVFFFADSLELSHLAPGDQKVSLYVLEESIFINIVDQIGSNVRKSN